MNRFDPVTWGEFKAWVEARAVEDADEIGFIDFQGGPHELERRPCIGEPEIGWVEIS